MIDLRSDTVTRPTPAMRQFMAAAEVGDDVFGDDPTVIALERRTAELLGKEAAVYMPSGSMTNQVAIRAHTEPGDEIIVEVETHTYFYEAGGPGALSGVMCRLLVGERGIFTAAQVKAALRPRNLHFPPTKLVLIENTHNRGGGSIWPLEQVAEVAAAAHEAGLKTHLDGARLWNASAATGVPEREYARHFDTVSVCFSKGLGAPVGSALAGTSEFVARARRFRKQFGGAMRQAGIIAAPGLVALRTLVDRLAEDHENAACFAMRVAAAKGLSIDLATVQTNIVNVDVKGLGTTAATFGKHLEARGVRGLPGPATVIRFVTYRGVTRADAERAAAVVSGLAADGPWD